MKNFVIHFEHLGCVKKYRAVAQISEQIALSAWRFYCIKKKIHSPKFIKISEQHESKKKRA